MTGCHDTVNIEDEAGGVRYFFAVGHISKSFFVYCVLFGV